MDALLEILCYYLKIDGKFVQNFYGFVYLTVPRMSSKDTHQQSVGLTSEAKNAKGSTAANEAAEVLPVASAAGQNANAAGTEEPVNSAKADVSDTNRKPASSKKNVVPKVDRSALFAAAGAGGGATAAAPASDPAPASAPATATATATAKAVVSVTGGGAAPAPAPAPAPASAPTSSKKPTQGGKVREVQPCVVPTPAIANFKSALSAETPVDPDLLKLANIAKQEAERLQDKKAAEELRMKIEAEKKRKDEAAVKHKELLAKHAATVREAEIDLEKARAKLKVPPFTPEDMDLWKSLSANPEAGEKGKSSAQSLLAAHAIILVEIEGLKKKVSELTAKKPVSAQEEVSRKKAAEAAQQKAAAEATAEAAAARTGDFNLKFGNFMTSQKGTAAHVLRKAANSAMSPQGTSVQRLCSNGMDPQALLCISASSGDEFVPLFRINAGTISLDPKWKSRFPKYDSSKASKGEETLSEEEYYKRCVMIAVFNFWRHAKTILTQKNSSRSEPLTMFQILANAANISDAYKYLERQEFVSQQRELYREQKQRETQEAAAASAKSKSSGSSNTFSELSNDASCDSKSQCAQGGSAEKEVSAPRGALLKTRGVHSDLVPKPSVAAASCRAKKGTVIQPTPEQCELLRIYFMRIYTKLGGLSTSYESFNNDIAAWGGDRADIMRILSQCGVNTNDPDAVFKFLKDYAFVERTESKIDGMKGRKKTVLRILDKDGNVLQKESAATGGAASAAGGAASADAADADDA